MGHLISERLHSPHKLTLKNGKNTTYRHFPLIFIKFLTRVPQHKARKFLGSIHTAGSKKDMITMQGLSSHRTQKKMLSRFSWRVRSSSSQLLREITMVERTLPLMK